MFAYLNPTVILLQKKQVAQHSVFNLLILFNKSKSLQSPNIHQLEDKSHKIINLKSFILNIKIDEPKYFYLLYNLFSFHILIIIGFIKYAFINLQCKYYIQYDFTETTYIRSCYCLRVFSSFHHRFILLVSFDNAINTCPYLYKFYSHKEYIVLTSINYIHQVHCINDLYIINSIKSNFVSFNTCPNRSSCIFNLKSFFIHLQTTLYS
jgi:hypothetical protein